MFGSSATSRLKLFASSIPTTAGVTVTTSASRGAGSSSASSPNQVPGAERRDLASVAHDLRLALEQHVEGVAALALADEHHVGRDVVHAERLRDDAPLLGRQLREQRHRGEVRGDVVELGA